jgi:hypothetical protein
MVQEETGEHDLRLFPEATGVTIVAFLHYAEKMKGGNKAPKVQW